MVRVEPGSRRVSQAIAVGNAPSAIAFGEGAVWVTNRVDGTISRIDPETNAVTSTVEVGASPTAIGIGEGATWVANAGDGTVARLPPDGGEVERAIDVGGSPSGLTVAGGAVWTSVRASPESHRGGTLSVELPAGYLSCGCIDPASYEFGSFSPRRHALRRADGISSGRRRGGLDPGRRLGHRGPGAQRRRSHVRVPTALRTAVLRRQRGRPGRLPELDRANAGGEHRAGPGRQLPVPGDRRGRPMRGAPEALRSFHRDRDRPRGADGHDPPERAGCGLPGAARAVAGERPAIGQPPAPRPRHPAPGNRSLRGRRL